MDSKEVLTFLHIKYKGDWEAINKALREHEEIDESVARKTIKGYCTDDEVKFATCFEPEYPAFLTKLVHPPLILEYKGRLENLTEGNIVMMETPLIENVLSQHMIKNAYIQDDQLIINEATRLWIEADDSKHVNKLVIKMPHSDCLNLMRQIAWAFVAVDGDESFVKSAPETMRKFAIPGNAGCATNALIKTHKWDLCDSWTDLRCEPEEREV